MKRNSSWIHPALEVRESSIHGRGVFAKSNVEQRERLAIFGGDIMLIDEVYTLPEPIQEFPMQIDERFVLGSRRPRKPEDVEFFNHSCNPSCGFKGQIFLVAMRDIEEGEEVTFDYAMVVSRSVGSDLVFEMQCSCGAPDCRRRITEDDWKLSALRSRYVGYFSYYLQEKIDAEAAQREVVGLDGVVCPVSTEVSLAPAPGSRLQETP
jgi:hypothetical protein